MNEIVNPERSFVFTLKSGAKKCDDFEDACWSPRISSIPRPRMTKHGVVLWHWGWKCVGNGTWMIF